MRPATPCTAQKNVKPNENRISPLLFGPWSSIPIKVNPNQDLENAHKSGNTQILFPGLVKDPAGGQTIVVIDAVVSYAGICHCNTGAASAEAEMRTSVLALASRHH